MRDLLRRHGASEVPAAGAAFDPAVHEAVSRQEDPAVQVPTVVGRAAARLLPPRPAAAAGDGQGRRAGRAPRRARTGRRGRPAAARRGPRSKAPAHAVTEPRTIAGASIRRRRRSAARGLCRPRRSGRRSFRSDQTRTTPLEPRSSASISARPTAASRWWRPRRRWSWRTARGAAPPPRSSAFAEDGDRLVGQIAKRQAITNPFNTVFAVKRLIGRKSDEPQVARARERPPLHPGARRPTATSRSRSATASTARRRSRRFVLTEIKEFAEEVLRRR